LRSLKRYSTL